MRIFFHLEMGKAFQRQQQERTHTRNFNFYYVKMYNKNLAKKTVNRMRQKQTNKIFGLKKALRSISKKHSSRKTGKEHKPAIYKRRNTNGRIRNILKMIQPDFKSEECKN